MKNLFVIEKKDRKSRRRRVRMISLLVSLLLASVLTAWLTMERGLLVEARTQAATEELAGRVLRFHVLADSDSEEDQQIKMKVKEAVLAWLGEQMEAEETLDGTKEFVRDHLAEIRELAEETVRDAGSSDGVTAQLTTDEFPEKTYGDVTFPAGTYEALRICIGSGEGHNWWCCLYPSLCFTDAVCGKVVPEDKQELSDVLDEDAYEMITCTSDFKIKWFFFDRDLR